MGQSTNIPGSTPVKKQTNWGKRIFFYTVVSIVVWLLLAVRSEYHQWVLWAWKHKIVFLVTALLAFCLYKIWKKKKHTSGDPAPENHIVRKFILSVLIVGFVASWFTPWVKNRYYEMYMWYMCNHINKIQIDELPCTDRERIHPRNNIETMAHEKIETAVDVTTPQLVRDPFVDSTQDVWTMAAEPAAANGWQRWTEDIQEVFMVPADQANPNFAKHRIETRFTNGQTMHLDKNTKVAATKALGLRYFYMEPDQSYFMHNDKGELVEVVSLIEWSGLFFPVPTFGGVIVMPAGENSFGQTLSATLIGKGEYLSPEECHATKYLQGQNILAERISRLYAESFMYLHGYYKSQITEETAIEVPKLPEDENEYPFVTSFTWKHTHLGAEDGLYHYFGMEPINHKRTGLVVSLFIPADGTNRVYYYDHGTKKEGLSGVTAMPAKIKNSDMHIDWNSNVPVEFRPYIPIGIPELKGANNFFWLTTVVTLRKADSSGKRQFDGAVTPKLVICNAQSGEVIWLDEKHPNSWVRSIRGFYGFDTTTKPAPVKDTIKVLPVVAPIPSDTIKH